MAYVQRDPNSSGSVHGIPKAYAGVVLVALFGLVVLNRLFGSVSVSGGIK